MDRLTGSTVSHASEAGRQAPGSTVPRADRRSRVVVVHPVVASYRVGFFDRVAARLGDRFVVYASARHRGVTKGPAEAHSWERRLGPVRALLPGLEWQPGAIAVPVRRGDVVVVSGEPRCLSNLGLLLKARLAGARVIWWGQYWSATSRSWRKRLRLAMTRLCHALLFYTEAEAAAYVRGRTGVDDRVFALNNGIETGDIAVRRAPYDARIRGRRLLFLGRLIDKAELDLLLRALADPACADVRLEVIGGGEAEGALRALARTLGVQERVSWRGSTVDEDRIAEVANTCAAFVYPGAVGLSLIHALAYGLPAIVHDDRWRHYPEIAALCPGGNGLVFRRGDAASLARTISAALNDLAGLERMSAEAVETTRRSFNAEDMAERFCRVVSFLEKSAVRERRGSTTVQDAKLSRPEKETRAPTSPHRSCPAARHGAGRADQRRQP